MTALIEQVADALDTAHAAGLIHRDVKPSNVLVTSRPGGREFVYLIDFGIAQAADGAQVTTTGRAVGTLAYMAPERFDGAGTLVQISALALPELLVEIETIAAA